MDFCTTFGVSRHLIMYHTLASKRRCERCLSRHCSIISYSFELDPSPSFATVRRETGPRIPKGSVTKQCCLKRQSIDYTMKKDASMLDAVRYGLSLLTTISVMLVYKSSVLTNCSPVGNPLRNSVSFILFNS